MRAMERSPLHPGKVAQWHRCQKLLTDQTGKFVFKARSIYRSCKPHADWQRQAGITMDNALFKKKKKISCRNSISYSNHNKRLRTKDLSTAIQVTIKKKKKKKLVLIPSVKCVQEINLVLKLLQKSTIYGISFYNDTTRKAIKHS